MPDSLNQHYLELDQYADSSHLDQRIRLHQEFSTNKYGWYRWVFDQFDFPPGIKIFEIGCGPGKLWTENKYRIQSSWSVVLSDFSPGMVAISNKNIQPPSPHFSWIVANAMAIPFTSETFSAVIANHMLYHIPDRQRALSEISRVLKPGGWFFAATNGDNHMRELSEILDQFLYIDNARYASSFSAGKFTLENGESQLRPWFSRISVQEYVDSLIVTDSAALLAYILSMVPTTKLPDLVGPISNLSSLFEKLISQHGSINIQKSSGIFICAK